MKAKKKRKITQKETQIHQYIYVCMYVCIHNQNQNKHKIVNGWKLNELTHWNHQTIVPKQANLRSMLSKIKVQKLMQVRHYWKQAVDFHLIWVDTQWWSFSMSISFLHRTFIWFVFKSITTSWQKTIPVSLASGWNKHLLFPCDLAGLGGWYIF